MAGVGTTVFAKQAENYPTVAFYDKIGNPVPDLALGNGEKLEITGEQNEWYSIKIVAAHFEGRQGFVKKKNTHAGEPCSALCGKPSWNGNANEFCCMACKNKGPAAPTITDKVEVALEPLQSAPPAPALPTPTPPTPAVALCQNPACGKPSGGGPFCSMECAEAASNPPAMPSSPPEPPTPPQPQMAACQRCGKPSAGPFCSLECSEAHAPPAVPTAEPLCHNPACGKPSGSGPFCSLECSEVAQANGPPASLLEAPQSGGCQRCGKPSAGPFCSLECSEGGAPPGPPAGQVCQNPACGKPSGGGPFCSLECSEAASGPPAFAPEPTQSGVCQGCGKPSAGPFCSLECSESAPTH